jgi:hypothetical protein
MNIKPLGERQGEAHEKQPPKQTRQQEHQKEKG